MGIGSVESKGRERFLSVTDLYVSGSITTSGSIQMGLSVVDGDSDLILSSSATSQITVSGNLNTLGTIRSNGLLLVSGSVGGGEVTGSTNFFTTNTLDAQGMLTNSSGTLTLSSSNLITYVSATLSATKVETMVGNVYSLGIGYPYDIVEPLATSTHSGTANRIYYGAAYGMSGSTAIWTIVGATAGIQTSTTAQTNTWLTQSKAGSYNNDFNCVAYGTSGSFPLWTIAGNAGEIQTSTETVDWTKRTQAGGYAGNFRRVAHGTSGSSPLWVLVGDSGEIQTSPEGVDWTKRTQAGGYAGNFKSVAYGLSGSSPLWVAVGTAGEIQTSPEGVDWTRRTAVTSNQITDIRFGLVEGLPMWMAVGVLGEVQTSPEGIVWTRKFLANNSTFNINSVCYLKGLWVAVAALAVQTSPDGTNWISKTLNGAPSYQYIASGSDIFVSVGLNSAVHTGALFVPIHSHVVRSGDNTLKITDGLGGTGSLEVAGIKNSVGHITLSSSVGSTITLSSTLDIIGGNSKSYTIKNVGTDFILTSSVIYASGAISSQYQGIIPQITTDAIYLYSSGTSLMTTVSSSALLSAGGIYLGKDCSLNWRTSSSIDAVSFWKRRNPATASRTFTDVSIGKSGSSDFFVIVGSNAVINTSPTAVGTWTSRTAASSYTGQFTGVAYGTSGSSNLWVAVGAGPQIQTSPEGVVWTRTAQTSSDTTTAGFVRVAYGLSGSSPLWVAITSKQIHTSREGIDWTITTQTSSYTGAFQSVAYGLSGSSSLWVAVGSLGEIQTSPEGKVWTKRDLQPVTADPIFRRVYYGNGQWVAVGTNSIYTSNEGVEWLQRRFAFPNNAAMNALAYASGVWVAAGDNLNIQCSFDGKSWTKRNFSTDSGINAGFYGATYGNEVFVVVGQVSEIETAYIGSFNDLTLTRGSDNTLRISDGLNGTGSLDVANVKNSAGNLILSSSAGSIVAISSSLKLFNVPQSSLPAGNDNLSGSIAWVSDAKCFSIYGPEGWVRIVTGSL